MNKYMKNKTIGIYAIFRKCDDRCMYIGQSKDCKARIRQHLNGTTNTPIENKDDYYADIIEKHGFDSSVFRLEREAFWINIFEPEWNIDKNRTRSEETKRKISKNNGAHRPEVRQKMSKNNGARRPEVRQKMSKNNGAHRPEVRQKMREAKLGDKNPTKRAEVRQKMREAKLGKPSNTLGKHWKLDPITNKRIYY